MNSLYLDEKYNILYQKNRSDYFEPIAINYNISTNECELIEDIPHLFSLVKYVSFVRRKKNPKNGKFRILPLFTYQWSSIINNIQRVLDPRSERVLNAWARQSGKSESIKLTFGYLQSFGMMYLETKLDRFSSVLASFDAKSVKKLFKETKPYILKGLELFNIMFPHSSLISDKENSRLENNATKLEINRIIDGEELPWSQIFAITTGSQNDSLSCHCMIVDESGLVNNHDFEVSSTPFTTATNAPIFLYGLPTNSSASFLFQNFLNSNTTNVIHPWEDIYKLRLLTDKKMAEGYKLDVTNRMRGNEKSSYIRWNYYCDFEDSNGKFITRKVLTDSKILTETIDTPITNKKNWIILGVDISPKHDYFSMTLTEHTFDSFGNPIIKVKYMKTVNKNRERRSMEFKCNEIVSICDRFKVDIVCVDSTSQQLYFIQTLYNAMRDKKCKTQMFPYPYSSNMKEKLFGYLETMLYDQRLNLLLEDESWESEKLVEEMLYLKKEKKENRIEYKAPDSSSGDFSDDHINSLALSTIGYHYAFECSNNRKEFNDGEHVWRPRLQKLDWKPKESTPFPRTYMTVL